MAKPEDDRKAMRSRLNVQLLTVTRLRAELRAAEDTYNTLERQLINATKAGAGFHQRKKTT